jgi:hypothetical protein
VLKYLIERKQQENIEKEYGPTSAAIFTLASNIYNVYSEQADLRSWQSLPAEIRVARLSLTPGQYRLRMDHLAGSGKVVDTAELGERDLCSGKTYFFVSRARR